MTKSELANYLANLLTIMVSKESAGVHRGMTLADEYTRGYSQLIQMIKENPEDETRTSPDDNGGTEARADRESGFPRRS